MHAELHSGLVRPDDSEGSDNVPPVGDTERAKVQTLRIARTHAPQSHAFVGSVVTWALLTA